MMYSMTAAERASHQVVWLLIENVASEYGSQWAQFDANRVLPTAINSSFVAFFASNKTPASKFYCLKQMHDF